MSIKVIGASLGVAALVGAVIFWSRFPVATQEVTTAAAESDGCPITGAGQCQAAGTRQITDGLSVSGAPSPESANQHDFRLEKLGGGTVTLAQYRGHKPVIVDFWASWCPNCRRDMPRLNRWYEQYRDQVEVIGINLQEDSRVVEQFVQSSNIAFPIALDPHGVTSASFGIQFTNTHFLFNKSGKLVRVIPGDINEVDIVSLLES